MTVEYEGLPPEAQAAFQFAVNIWKSALIAPVEIKIRATWQALDQQLLGSGGPSTYFRNFTGAPRRDVGYPVARANQFANADLAPTSPDMVAMFNSTHSWYFGTDGRPPAGSFDFVTEALQIIGFGLSGGPSFKVVNGSGSWGLASGTPTIFDQYVVNGSNQLLVSSFANPSTALADQLQANNLFFSGPAATAGARGTRPKLYAPNPWAQSLSLAHLDEQTYPAGDPNSLITPQLAPGESAHDPGPIFIGFLQDFGWQAFDRPFLTFKLVVPELSREDAP